MMRKVRKLTKAQVTQRKQRENQQWKKAQKKILEEKKRQAYIDQVFPLFVETRLSEASDEVWMDKARQIKEEFQQKEQEIPDTPPEEATQPPQLRGKQDLQRP